MKKTVIAVAFLLVVSLSLTGCGLTVPRPEIKEGEFDFSVTYEIDGKINTVSGVYVCKYEGVDWALDSGYHRDWSGYIKGGKLEDMIEIGTTDDGGVIQLDFDLYADYFMGDIGSYEEYASVPMLTVVHIDGEGMSIQNEADVIEDLYGARIVSYKYDAPVENSFGVLNF